MLFSATAAVVTRIVVVAVVTTYLFLLQLALLVCLKVFLQIYV